MSVHMVIAIHQPDTEPEWSVDKENEVYYLVADYADEITAELREQFGKGWMATLDV